MDYVYVLIELVQFSFFYEFTPAISPDNIQKWHRHVLYEIDGIVKKACLGLFELSNEFKVFGNCNFSFDSPQANHVGGRLKNTDGATQGQKRKAEVQRFQPDIAMFYVGVFLCMKHHNYHALCARGRLEKN